MTNFLSLRRLRFALLVSVLGVTVLVPASRLRAAQPKIKIGYDTDDLEKGKGFGFDHVELLVRNFTALNRGCRRCWPGGWR
jgi:uncharacterized membrane protein